MACTFTTSEIENLSYACNVAFGGIKAIKVEGGTGESKKVINIEFNTSDGFTNANETKTVSPDGTISVAQTLQVELPKIEKDKLDAIKAINNPNMELKCHILTKSGVMVTYGDEYGCYVSTVDSASGTGRSDKNRIQITFTGDESKLAPVTDDGKTAFESIESYTPLNTMSDSVSSRRTRSVTVNEEGL